MTVHRPVMRHLRSAGDHLFATGEPLLLFRGVWRLPLLARNRQVMKMLKQGNVLPVGMGSSSFLEVVCPKTVSEHNSFFEEL